MLRPAMDMRGGAQRAHPPSRGTRARTGAQSSVQFSTGALVRAPQLRGARLPLPICPLRRRFCPASRHAAQARGRRSEEAGSPSTRRRHDLEGWLAEAPPALGSYVEAALRTMHGTRAGPSVSWLGDLIDYLIAARPPAPLSEVVGEPLVGGDHADTLRSFSLTLPWMHVLMPELRHTTDCHTAHLRLDGISVHGVSIDEAAFKSAQRLHIDSLQVDIQPKGRDAPITFIPATKNVRGTIASLAVHSPGFENMKSQTKLSIPCLSLCFCPSVYGALMQLMGYSQYFLHEDLPPWQQQVYSLSEFDVHLDEMRIVLFDEDPVVTATSCGPYASSGGASSKARGKGPPVRPSSRRVGARRQTRGQSPRRRPRSIPAARPFKSRKRRIGCRHCRPRMVGSWRGLG